MTQNIPPKTLHLFLIHSGALDPAIYDTHCGVVKVTNVRKTDTVFRGKEGKDCCVAGRACYFAKHYPAAPLTAALLQRHMSKTRGPFIPPPSPELDNISLPDFSEVVSVVLICIVLITGKIKCLPAGEFPLQ